MPYFKILKITHDAARLIVNNSIPRLDKINKNLPDAGRRAASISL
jgi:hypothetical protein